MKPTYRRTRPGLLTFIGVVSLIWSSLSLVGVAVGTILSLALGGGSWLGGPAVGAIGSAIALVVILWLVASSLLSILLFVAGLRTLRDDPSGLGLHRLWAWISLVLSVLTLLGSGRSSSSWAGLAYAVTVLYVTGLPEVRAYVYGSLAHSKPGKPGHWDDDLA
jgi:hypothetical protein